MAKKKPFNEITWNALAIIVVLAVYPLATGLIASAGNTGEGVLYENVFQNDKAWASGLDWWYNNGNYNATYAYPVLDPNYVESDFYCIYISDGECSDYGQSGLHAKSQIGYGQVAQFGGALNDEGKNYVMYRQTHNNDRIGFINDPPYDYYGYSGNGGFEWVVSNYTLEYGFEDGEALSDLRITMYDPNFIYDCVTYNFDEFVIEYSIEFYEDGNFGYSYPNVESYKYDGYTAEVSNKYELIYFYQNQWQTDCFIGFELEYEFSNLEILELKNLNNFNWSDTNMKINIDSVSPPAGSGQSTIGQDQLPFAGIYLFNFAIEKKTAEIVVLNSSVRALTLVLTGATIILAVASTEYWNPFKATLRGLGR